MAKIRAQAGQWNSCIELQARDENGYAGRMVFEKKPDHQILDAFLRIDHSSAQVLMDDLWQAGLRPSEGSGSAGSLKATENHLKDMQRIAFKLLGDEID